MTGSTYPRMRILIIDDEPSSRFILKERLSLVRDWTLDVEEAEDARSAFDALSKRFFDLVFLDYRLPDEDGLNVLDQVRQLHPKIVVIMMSAYGSEKIAVAAMKHGAMDYLTRQELAATDLAHLLRSALDVQNLQTENFELHAVIRMKDEFIAGVSHELRTPLAVIMGYARTLEDGEFGELTPAQKTAAAAIRSRSEQFLHSINRLLTFKESSVGAHHVLLRPVDLSALVSDHLRVHWAEIPRGITIEKDVPPDLIWVLADPEPLGEVLKNLISNACKFSPEGSRVNISLKLRSTQEAWFQVRDAGRGVAPDALPRLFEGFFHAEKELTRGVAGLGIGLALSRQIVELHGGRIWIESEGPGKGTTASIALPVTARAAPQVVVEPQRKAVRRRILIVENNPDMVEILQLFLAGFSENLAVSTTHDGQEALDLIERDRYDLMMLDLLLPGLSGLDVLKRLKRLPPEKRVPVLVITGHRDAGAQALRSGAAGLLIKPFYKSAFIEKVSGLLGMEGRSAPASGGPSAPRTP